MPKDAATARVFRSGNSQAVRLPREFRVSGPELLIRRRGDEIILREPPANLGAAYRILRGLPPDFMRDGRGDRPPEPAEGLA